MSAPVLLGGGNPPAMPDQLDGWRRDPAMVMAPERLGAARPTRHSFTASLLRTMVGQRWAVVCERWSIDGDGCGEAVYRVDTPTDVLRFVAFSTEIAEQERTDRVIGKSWDVTAALIDGPLDQDRMARLRTEVPRQEQGTADADTLIWTRGNRSSRFFEHAVSALADGRQPDPDLIGCSPYLIRSTAYYGNGRFGMATYDGLRCRPAVAVPYRAHMLTAWLFREFSTDLVEHMAKRRNPASATLNPAWRRGLGIGNATGLGMVPFAITHPAILDRWVGVRETALAAARSRTAVRARRDWTALQHRLVRAIKWCHTRAGRPCAPFQDTGSLASELDSLAERARSGPLGPHPFDGLWRHAEDTIGVEAQELLLTVLADLDNSLDAPLEATLHVKREEHAAQPLQSIGDLRDKLRRYDWVQPLATESGSQHWFWYYARDNEEPRRGVRGVDPGEHVEMPVGIVPAVHAMTGALDGWADDAPVAAFLLRHPEHRAAVARVQHHADLPYAEVRDNLLATDFLPLQLQRFQLAMYGANDFVPQSTDWVRVTLMNGLPTRHELSERPTGEFDLFPPLPHQQPQEPR